MTTFREWADLQWPGLHDWLEDGERGASACAIVKVICGVPDGRQQTHYPHDDADHGRCLALLRAVPSIAPHLNQMTRRNIAWKRAVNRLRKEIGQ